MSKTTIFISSTCYDLAAIREDLRRCVTQLGHEPLLSEYSSFPVDPDEEAIANCKKNVSNHTDILILIIGGRRGYIDPRSGKSVTNLEYDEARRLGIPCFIFIKREVVNLLPVWIKNREADFTPSVDYPDVFQFVERIKTENSWIFSFDRLEEIEECIKNQLSFMMRELLVRKRAGNIDPIASYANESAKARKLAGEKPSYWEHLLTAELLGTKLTEVRRQYSRLKAGLLFSQSKPIPINEVIPWVRAKIRDLEVLVAALQGQLPLIQESWGPPGQPGDPQEIQKSVDDFIQLCSLLVRWETELRAVTPPDAFISLRKTMEGWTEVIYQEMERLPEELLRPFKGSDVPKGIFEIRLTIKSPSTEGFQKELERLSSEINPWNL